MATIKFADRLSDSFLLSFRDPSVCHLDRHCLGRRDYSHQASGRHFPHAGNRRTMRIAKTVTDRAIKDEQPRLAVFWEDFGHQHPQA